MTASGATPSLGPERGGTRVACLAAASATRTRCVARLAARVLRCSLGTSTSLSSSASRQCTLLGVASVLLSMNGQQYAPSGVSFTYQPSASVSYISPATALSEGGTPLTVHGAGFSSASEALGVLTCRIGGAVRRAVWASSSAIVCNATRASAGEARVEVSNNAREYTSSGVRLRLVSLRVLDVQPWSGPVGGATVVSVLAHGSWPGGLAVPVRRGASSAGWSGGASRLRCLTPPSSGGVSGWVGVQLSSFHGALSSGGSFYYHAPMTASGATPSIGPERGGTRVGVLGGGFRDAYTLRCAFGSSAAPVLARYVDESQLECVSPVHAPGIAAVLLSMNGQQYASERRLVHVPAVGVCELHLSGDGAVGGRHACDGARRGLLVGVGGARRADVPYRRRGASRGVGELERDRVQRDARVCGRGSRRGEQQRARVHVERRASSAGVAARARRAAVERPGRRRDGGERGGARLVAGRSCVAVSARERRRLAGAAARRVCAA